MVFVPGRHPGSSENSNNWKKPKAKAFGYTALVQSYTENQTINLPIAS